MSYYITCNQNGEIVGANEYTEFHDTSGLVQFYAEQGIQAVEVSAEQYATLKLGVLDDTHYYDGSEFIEIPAKPSEFHTFDFETKQWAAPATLLSDLKAETYKKIEARREALSVMPIELDGVLFDGDLKAQSNVSAWLNVINSGASVPAGFVWRDYTNNDHPADAQFVRELATALAMRGTALYAASWAHKAAVGALQSVADVLAYNVQANW